MIAEKLSDILNSLPENVTLVAVSKTFSTSKVLEAYNTGQRVFGENKVQELLEKQAVLPNNIHWHLIGHLQSNKVKYIAPFISLIHSVDSLKLLKEINKQAMSHNRVIQCLLQFHIAEETSKFGLTLEEAKEILISKDFENLKNIQLVGVMGMATFINDNKIVKKEFQFLKSIFENLKSNYFSKDESFKEISMGMSNDYLLAIEEGSTMVRVGSLIFGGR